MGDQTIFTAIRFLGYGLILANESSSSSGVAGAVLPHLCRAYHWLASWNSLSTGASERASADWKI